MGPHHQHQRYQRPAAGNLSGGARNVSLAPFAKTLLVQLSRYGITVNCIHRGTTRTERTPNLLATRAAELGITPEEVEERDFTHGSPRGNAIWRMAEASEMGYLTVYLASDKAWAITGGVIVANGGTGQTVYD
jgi:NAD(P)-dependent dehydrogenase (short-subunit alcohol dehydrogenase family)